MAVLLHAAKSKAALQTQRDVAHHVREFLLNQLIGGERAAELLAVEHVLPRDGEAGLGGAERAPGDAVARRVEAGERTLQACHLGQQVFVRREGAVEHDLAGDGRAQTHLAVNRGRAQALRAFLKQETADDPVLGLRPDEKNIRDGRV